MIDIVWATAGVDRQLIVACPSFEQYRLSFWGAYLLILAGMLAGAVFLYSVELQGHHFVASNWLDVLLATCGAAFSLLLSLSLFRLMFTSVRLLRVGDDPKAHSWAATVWVKLGLTITMGLLCGIAACLLLFRGDASFVLMHTELSTTSNANTLSLQDSSSLDDLYQRLASLPSQKVKKEGDAADLQQSIKDIRQRIAQEKSSSQTVQAKEVGTVALIEYLFTMNRSLCALICAIFVFLYCAPVVVNVIATHGTYEYLGEIQGILALARQRIIPNAQTLWQGEERQHIDRYFGAEALLERKISAYAQLRSNLQTGLTDCLVVKKREFSKI